MDTLISTKNPQPEISSHPEATIQASQFVEITKTNTDEKIKGLILEPDQILNKSSVLIEGRDNKVQTLHGDTLNSIKRSIDFSKKNPQERIDCTFFAAMASGAKNLKTRGEFNTDEDYAAFFRTKYDWDFFIEPNVGQMIVIGNKDKQKTNEFKTRHYAVYLGSGLYISKFHEKSPVVITDLENMKQWFHTDVAFVATPKVSVN